MLYKRNYQPSSPVSLQILRKRREEGCSFDWVQRSTLPAVLWMQNHKLRSKLAIDLNHLHRLVSFRNRFWPFLAAPIPFLPVRVRQTNLGAKRLILLLFGGGVQKLWFCRSH